VEWSGVEWSGVEWFRMRSHHLALSVIIFPFFTVFTLFNKIATYNTIYSRMIVVKDEAKNE
jgi:hypothetical protein